MRPSMAGDVARRDATCFSSHDLTDPLFGATLREVVRCGVEAICYQCEVGRTQIRLAERIPVRV